jgi:hypothetical protein
MTEEIKLDVEPMDIKPIDPAIHKKDQEILTHIAEIGEISKTTKNLVDKLGSALDDKIKDFEEKLKSMKPGLETKK